MVPQAGSLEAANSEIYASPAESEAVSSKRPRGRHQRIRQRIRPHLPLRRPLPPIDPPPPIEPPPDVLLKRFTQGFAALEAFKPADKQTLWIPTCVFSKKCVIGGAALRHWRVGKAAAQGYNRKKAFVKADNRIDICHRVDSCEGRYEGTLRRALEHLQ